MTDYHIVPDRMIELVIGGKPFKIYQKIIPSTYLATKDIASWIKKGQPIKPCSLIGGDGKPRGITIHNTPDITNLVAGMQSAAEQYALATYNGNLNGAAVHYYVSDPEHIWQLLSDDERGWHASDGSSRRKGHAGNMIGGNLDTIAIEGVGENSTEAVAMLAGYLCRKHKLNPMVDVYTHNWFMGQKDDAYTVGARKNCPYWIIPKWKWFLGEVERYMNDVKAAPTSNAPVVCATTNVTACAPAAKWCAQVGAFKNFILGLALKAKVGKAGYKAFTQTKDGIMRVYIGRFTTKGEADAAARALVEAGIITGYSVKEA